MVIDQAGRLDVTSGYRVGAMTCQKMLLTSTALVGAGAMAVAGSAMAAEVAPGGALDLELTGFARFEAFGGEQDDLQLDPTLSRSLDFRNDTEVQVIARAKYEQTGLEYGATIEFEADTNNTFNTDESWVFLRGGWGEVRIGDEDGVVDYSAIGAHTIAAGTGGIDGSNAVSTAAEVVFLKNSSDATKVRYYTPSFGELSLGVSYTPTQEIFDSGADNGQAFATKNDPGMDAKNIVEGAIVYDGKFGGAGLQASVVGLYAELENVGEADFGEDKWWGIQGGAVLDIYEIKVAGNVASDNVGDTEKEFFTAGIAFGFGPVNASVTYGQIFNTNADYDELFGISDQAYNLVFSADYTIAAGLVLAGDVSKFDNDTTDGTGRGDKGWTAVGSFRVAF